MFKRLLVANRGEIAIRVLRAANELGLQTVAIYSKEDKLALHRFKADESYPVGEELGPVQAYLSIDEVLRVAKQARVDAIHPGYGFLSENPDFAEACAQAGITFIGPSPETMRRVGNKVSARNLAEEVGVPVVPATGPLSHDEAEIKELAAAVGYPLMLKASWGGGGRGMRAIESEDQLLAEVMAGRREAEAAFGNGEVYLEKLIRRARHVEVQILGDSHGQLVHLFERDCSVQRRNQKIVERAPAPYLDEAGREDICQSALTLLRAANYKNAGTVEFLMDADTEAFYFIEVNPRVQVEHTVTEEITGIDIVKAQIRIAGGARIGLLEGKDASGVPPQADIRHNGHALQCRITTEDPEANFIPDYGRITAYRGATGFGIRLDGGTAYSGAVITRYYDSMLEKVTAWAPSPEEAIDRMDRALREFRIRGVATNLTFVEGLINHPTFRAAAYTTKFIDETPELFRFTRRRDRATRLLRYIADVTINGNAEVKGREKPRAAPKPSLPPVAMADAPPKGTKDLLEAEGPKAVADWMKAQKQVLFTDTTMRDAHQSLLATRLRTYDMLEVAPAYARALPQLFSLECWGGATFDVALRFLHEDPWERLARLREAVPNVLLQMLLRSSNAVGYTNYPDNVVQHFVARAAEGGVDVFRVFDSLNWVENMRVALDAVQESGKICEAAICYTGDIHDPARARYDLNYYLKMARELEAAGAHILGIKDMAGLLKPRAARELVRALKQETSLPLHLHMHDTSGIAAASLLAAVEEGVDAIDAAMDSFSGLTSQPNLGSLAEALKGGPRDSGLDPATIRAFSDYWEGVRLQYRAFESDTRAGASEVYLHEMPGGQFTNLKEQARSLGLEERWHEVARAYAEVNQAFGDIVKVTPTSKVVGDMALSLVSAGQSTADLTNPDKDITIPESVVSLFRGDLGRPEGGFPEALQKKILKGEKPIEGRPGLHLAPADLSAEKGAAEKKAGRSLNDFDFASALMYPKVFQDYAAFRRENGPVSMLPTPVFFYGMQPGQETSIELEKGKTLALRCLAIGEPHEDGTVEVFFELNGQPRMVRVAHRDLSGSAVAARKAEDGNGDHLGAPMPGMISTIAIKAGQKIKAGDVLLTLEAMKMETVLHADRDGTIAELLVTAGQQVDAKDLLLTFS
ncbi:pyruvate carboxylase [Rhodovibrionaceae bacterium A322]